MDRPEPTDPPEEPVNRIAWAMEPGAHEPPAEIPPDVGTSVPASTSLQSDLDALLHLYVTDPESDHLPELLVFTHNHMGDPESALMFLEMIGKGIAGPLDFSGSTAVFQLMIRDLQRHLEDGLSS